MRGEIWKQELLSFVSSRHMGSTWNSWSFVPQGFFLKELFIYLFKIQGDRTVLSTD